jgi:alpha-tubulin suppressor-like RCC1 family protein
MDLSTDFVQVSAGYQHTCALHESGAISCWGDDGDGQVSNPNADPLKDFSQISANGGQTCALRRDGSFQCWGAYSF